MKELLELCRKCCDAKSESEREAILKEIYPGITQEELYMLKEELPEELRQPEPIGDK